MEKSSFKEKVYKIVSQIPRGEVMSYSEVAKKAGSPRACRAVGNLMNHNPDPQTIPCHRVIAANNRLGGFAWGKAAKSEKLQTEGWRIIDDKLIK